MANVLTAAELKRRGMVAIEEGLRAGPLHILKRNKPAAVVQERGQIYFPHSCAMDRPLPPRCARG